LYSATRFTDRYCQVNALEGIVVEQVRGRLQSDARDLLPRNERSGAKHPTVRSAQQIAPDPKQIADDAVDGNKGVLAAHRAGWPCIPAPNEFTRGNDFALATRVVDNLD
jgi:hypothetical protein